MPSGEKICEKQLYKVMDDIERFQVNEEQIAPFLPDIMRKLDWLDKEDIIKRVVGREFIRFAEYYSNAPDIENVTPQKIEEEKKAKKEKRRIARNGFNRMFINVGKLDGINPATKIGKNCRIQRMVGIGPSFGTNNCPTIGDNVYIGPGARLYGDIEIADNCWIGANAVVNKSFLEPYSVIAGVPAKVVKIETRNWMDVFGNGK